MFDLSIVLPTCNRAHLLGKAIATVASTTSCNYEIIVVDGASTDNTQQVLGSMKQQLGDRLKIIREEKREGFVRAANLGFRAATGRNLTWINDDAWPIGPSLDQAVLQMDSADADVAFVALFHHWHSQWNIAYETTLGNRRYQLCHVRGTLYANFPVGKRATYEKLGFFDERYFVCSADPDLSLKAWHAGMRIVPAFGAIIDHDETIDHRRQADAQRGEDDNAKLFAKWNLPARNPRVNDFDPTRPCTLIGLNQQPNQAPNQAHAA